LGDNLTGNSTKRGGAGLKDVARVAGVSATTVSRALNSPEMLDAETLSRVQKAVQKLRYMPNAQARALRSQRSFALGAVVPTFEYAFYASTTGALESSVEPEGFALFLASHHFDLKKEVKLTRALIERGVEGFMFIGLDHDPELFVLLNEYRRPYVLAWALDRTGRHASVGYDVFGAMHANDRRRERSS
jgi:LacI family transcriptional regulator